MYFTEDAFHLIMVSGGEREVGSPDLETRGAGMMSGCAPIIT